MIARRDRAAVGEAYRLHGAAVYGLMRAMCGPAQAAAGTAEVFACLTANPDALAFDDGPLKSWLLALAHKRAVEQMRGDVGRSRQVAQMSVTQAERDAIGRAGVEARRLLWRLPRIERQVIVLAYFGGLTRGRIAEVLRQPGESVASCLGAGLVKLRRLASTSARPSSQAPEGDEHLAAALGADLSDMARTLFETRRNDDAWAQLAVLAVSIVEGCDFAGVAVVEGDTLFSGPTVALGAEIDALQDHAGAGPSFDAVAYGLPLYVADLADDADWPTFGPQAAAQGVRSLLAIPLATTGTGVFNFYGSRPDAFGGDARAVGLLLARLADLGRFPSGRRRDWERQAEGLRSALRVREVVAQAQGVIMEREHVPAADAYNMLRHAIGQVSLALHEPVRHADAAAKSPVQPAPARPGTHRRKQGSRPGP